MTPHGERQEAAALMTAQEMRRHDFSVVFQKLMA
jgi:hypothetical protein